MGLCTASRGKGRLKEPGCNGFLILSKGVGFCYTAVSFIANTGVWAVGREAGLTGRFVFALSAGLLGL